MRIEIPPDFDAGPLFAAIRKAVNEQHHRICGQVVRGEFTLVIKPQWMCEEPVAHPNVTPITHRRAVGNVSHSPRPTLPTA